MAGLVPAIHVLLLRDRMVQVVLIQHSHPSCKRSSAAVAQDVDGRDKPGHDDGGGRQRHDELAGHLRTDNRWPSWPGLSRPSTFFARCMPGPTYDELAS